MLNIYRSYRYCKCLSKQTKTRCVGSVKKMTNLEVIERDVIFNITVVYALCVLTISTQ